MILYFIIAKLSMMSLLLKAIGYGLIAVSLVKLGMAIERYKQKQNVK